MIGVQQGTKGYLFYADESMKWGKRWRGFWGSCREGFCVGCSRNYVVFIRGQDEDKGKKWKVMKEDEEEWEVDEVGMWEKLNR